MYAEKNAQFTRTPEQIGKLFKFSADVIYKHIYQGLWAGKGIYIKTASGKYMINPEAFGKWYKEMLDLTARYENRKKNRSNTLALVAVICLAFIGFAMFSKVVFAAMAAIALVIVGYRYLCNSKNIISCRRSQEVINTNDIDNDDEFFDFLSENHPDYSTDYKYSDLFCNTHNPDYYGHTE